MRVFIASDLHYQHSERGDRAVQQLAGFVRRVGKPEDVLVLAGDQAVDDQGVRDCLRLFAGFAGQLLAVAGNHDVWVDPSQSRSSWQRYRDLSQLFQEEGFHALEDQPLLINGTAFVGSMGWYDYTFAHAPDSIPLSAYQQKAMPGDQAVSWSDAIYVRWPLSDKAMTDFQALRLRTHLQETAHAQERIVVMHHLPTSELLVQPRWLVPRHWRFANAYLGSELFGQLIEERNDIPTLVVAGHIHRHKMVRRRGVTYASMGGDYHRKELLIREPDGHCRRWGFSFKR